MAKKNRRSVKVYGQSGYKYRETLTIMLKVQWLAELGFQIGDYISISCEEGKLIITPDTERAAFDKAEKGFMSRELKALERRFSREKAMLHDQFVAENGTGYGMAKEA